MEDEEDVGRAASAISSRVACPMVESGLILSSAILWHLPGVRRAVAFRSDRLRKHTVIIDDSMRFFRQRKIASLVMIGTSGSLLAAQSLPLLPVDPALIDRNAVAKPRSPEYRQKTRAQAAATPVTGSAHGDGLPLKLSRHMMPLRKNKLVQTPIFIAADRINGRTDVDTQAEGNVELRKLGNVLTADQLSYRENDDTVDAVGHVRIQQDDDIISGPKVHLKIADNVGFFEEPEYSLKRQIRDAAPGQTMTGSGAASRIEFEGENHYRLTNATYSTCGPTDPDWFARAESMELDYDLDSGEAREATLVFEGVPILYSPWLTFPLNNRRKSGFLLPTFGSTSKNGFEVLEPYYWNIAPNMDATLSPRLMSKRGVELNGELRYLDQNYSGIFQGEYLPSDQVTHTNRSSYSLQHHHDLGMGFSADLNLNNVSDDTFFSDLSTRLTNISQTNVLREGSIGYGGGNWNARAMVQRYHTLQDPALPPVVQPYSRLPQISMNALFNDLPAGSTFTFNGDYVYFSHTTQIEGARASLYPQISFPQQSSAFFFTPKLGVNTTNYRLDPQNGTASEHIDRTLPIFSLDGGVFLERNTDWLGKEVIQTLEPRAYYLYIPYRDQSRIPLFDTGTSDFSASQLFAENRYTGADRIGDANQISLALTTRFLDQDTGAELFRAAVGQRYYFKSQRLVIPGELPHSPRTSDLLAGLSGKLMSDISLEAGIEYNPHTRQVDLLSLGGRYQPGYARSLSGNYRFNRSAPDPISGQNSVIKEIDVAGQWPLWDRYSGVGRYDYSLVDHRIIEGVGGIEYNAGCWASRLVLHRMATGVNDSSTSIFVQLELNGFSNIGTNPMDILKRNVPNYRKTNLPDPGPASNQDSSATTSRLP